VHEAVNLLRQKAFEPDVVLAVGGGSVLDFAKAVAASYASGKSVEEVFGVNNVPSLYLWLQFRQPMAQAQK